MLYRNLKKMPPGSAIAIGNFDGVHYGHQALIKQLLVAKDNGANAAYVILFEPHPKEYFEAQGQVSRIMSLRDKYDTLAKLGVDAVFCLRFNSQLATQTHESFYKDILRFIQPSVFVLGEDFCFGKNRQGDIAYLESKSKLDKFNLDVIKHKSHKGLRISSSKIRDVLLNGDLASYKDYTGREYFFSGRVVTGRRLGRRMGFKTANININSNKLPLNGVYIVAVSGNKISRDSYGIANIGYRPTVCNNSLRRLVEVHIYSHDQDIYGERIAIKFMKKIRDERKFANIDELKEQINSDSVFAKLYLADLTIKTLI
ncbi:MAG: bifunctional riboflavin kinase/FAD synthetase [Legionellales bacterium]|nr:bifunctional riboflavin kinase/FAD synthetase [Legionellales bacterium]